MIYDYRFSALIHRSPFLKLLLPPSGSKEWGFRIHNPYVSESPYSITADGSVNIVKAATPHAITGQNLSLAGATTQSEGLPQLEGLPRSKRPLSTSQNTMSLAETYFKTLSRKDCGFPLPTPQRTPVPGIIHDKLVVWSRLPRTGSGTCDQLFKAGSHIKSCVECGMHSNSISFRFLTSKQQRSACRKYMLGSKGPRS